MPYNLLQWRKVLFHITHVDNLPSILSIGLLSKNEALRLRMRMVSIADEGIQARRHVKLVPIGQGGTLHDYVPLFFAARSPMLYAVKSRISQADVIYLLIRWTVLDRTDTVFTDGNASSNCTVFLCGDQDLSRIDKEAARERYWGNSDPALDLKRKKSAEMLVWKKIEPDHIAGLAVLNEETQNRVHKVLRERNLTTKVFVTPEWYY